MYHTPQQFFEFIKDKTVAFVGIGVTNTEIIKLFARQGIRTIACDRRTEDCFDRQILEDFRDLRVSVRLGEGYLNGLDCDVLFRTPGMYFFSPELRNARREGMVVTSELEVFFDTCPCPIIAITGSDGKSTTSTVIAEMLRAEGKTVHLGGNIGKALLPHIFEIRPEDYAVVELSSFQLISMRTSPQIAVITNVEPNHLDVHGSMEEYIDAKRNIYLHQNAFSKTVLNKDNAITESFAFEVRGEAALFSLTEPIYHGAYVNRDGFLVLSRHGVETPLFHQDAIRIPGIHNVANYLAAVSAVSALVSPEAMRQVAEEFAGVEHRIEFVRERNGVRWYNDSIATSPSRVVAGLRSFDSNMILLAGGYDKKIPYQPMIPDMVEKVKYLLLMGPAADRMEQEITDSPQYQGKPEIIRVPDMAAAVAKAEELAQAGDVVSLSPACASFDQYPNFETRGTHYKELVHKL